MLLLFLLLLFLVGTCLLLLLPALWAEQTYHTYREARTVNCPETHAPVSVRFNALRAAWSSLSGPPNLRLADCTRWPERADCGQECIPDAVRAKPTPVVDHVPWRTRRVVHLPVLLAGAAAWVLGMAWHSEYLFRPQWMVALGLSDPETRTLARMMAPHLLSAGCVHTVRLRRRGTVAVAGFAYFDARHRSGDCALDGDLRRDFRSTDGGGLIADGLRDSVD